MTEQPNPDELARCHRWFAVEANNLAWAMAGESGRTPSDNLRMLTAAHTAAYHWSHAGGAVNAARADVTLAHAYALVGAGDLALTYATRALRFFTEHAAEGEDWDRAFAHAEMSHAAAVTGDAALHGEHYAEAQDRGVAIADPEDRAVFLNELARIPRTVICAT